MHTQSISHLFAASLLMHATFHFFSLTIFVVQASTSLPPYRRHTDGLTLLSFKAEITKDPLRSLALWNNSLHFCKWPGVTCNNRDGHSRVTALQLNSLGLAGSISPSLSNLTFLDTLSLTENWFTGSIPHQLGSLLHLHYLNLSFNNLQGGIPDKLGSITSLTGLTLDGNFLTGTIPPSFANLSSLTTLSLSFNSLSDHLPRLFCNLSSLNSLNLQANHFRGTLPHEIGYSLPRLVHLSISDNKLTGPIPNSLGKIQKLVRLNLDKNHLESGDWAFLTALTNCSNLQWLTLSNNRLIGQVPRTITNLSSPIQWIDLSMNQITGSIPYEISNLVELKGLLLYRNLLTGTIPATALQLPRLEALILADNWITGRIPWNYSSPLKQLGLSSNNIIGPIPRSIGNISSLTKLHLIENQLAGSIPSSLANIPGLTILRLSFNQLSGGFPSELWNHTSLTDLLVGSNTMLNGTLPPDIGQTLPNLVNFDITFCKFVGRIPDSLSNATVLETLYLSGNSFQGIIPTSLGSLQSLSDILLDGNQLEAGSAADWGFMDGLANGTSIKRLGLGGNKFSGELPRSLFNLSRVYQLSMSENNFSGRLPEEIANLSNITLLDFGGNNLSGSIPHSIGKLHRLQVLFLDRNRFTGTIPSSIGNLTMLNRLYLNANNLTGGIPSSLGNCPLELLNLTLNNLTGGIPTEILTIPTLSAFLGLAYNSLTGPLPLDVGALKNLKFMYIQGNKLSGSLPITLGKCQILEFLSMGNNKFHGIIPWSLQKLRGLKELDLSSNNLTGSIPEFFASFDSMINLNLSFNNLEGEVPTDGLFKNTTAFSVIGNKHLCGGQPGLNLPSCSNEAWNKKALTIMLVVINAIFLLVFVVVASFLWRRRYTTDPENVTSDRDQHEQISFSHRDYTETSYEALLNATDGFSSTNLIGVGQFSTVYKGLMDCDGIKRVAVKVLDLQQRGACKSFMAEYRALSSIRHRNLLKILRSCLTHDPRGNEFGALVLEYMPNGSLDAWLHQRATAPEEDHKRLGLIQRLNIATDVASALEYLHHHASTPIAHCDLKPANVLLDDDMIAHVGDFGLARIIIETAPEPTSTTGLRGSIGYVPPEYGWANRASTQGDVYSYGILLLEMFTGKAPTDKTFQEGMTLSRYVEMAYPKRVLAITDRWLLSDCDIHDDGYSAEDKDDKVVVKELDCDDGKELEDSRNSATRLRKCLTSVFRIGLFCTKEHHTERLQMGDVSRELMAAKVAFLRSLPLNLSTEL